MDKMSSKIETNVCRAIIGKIRFKSPKITPLKTYVYFSCVFPVNYVKTDALNRLQLSRHQLQVQVVGPLLAQGPVHLVRQRRAGDHGGEARCDDGFCCRGLERFSK
jgi:hypothetical protein